MKFLIEWISSDYPLFHTHANYELYGVVSGSGVIKTRSSDVAASQGSVIIIPSDVEHRSVSDEGGFERIRIIGDINHFFSLGEVTVIPADSADDAVALGRVIYNNRYGESEYTSALISALCHYVTKKIKMGNELFAATTHIIEQLSDSFHNSSLDVRCLLANSGYAEDYIRAYFKKITGKTPNRFLRETRIEHACFMIDLYGSVLPLSEIAEKCGYTDYVYFSRSFKEIKGMSPREYSSAACRQGKK